MMEDRIKRFTAAREVPYFSSLKNDKKFYTAAAESVMNELMRRLEDELCKGGTHLVEMSNVKCDWDRERDLARFVLVLKMREFVTCKDCKQAPKELSGVLFNFHCPIIDQIVCADDYCFMAKKREESDDIR